MSRCLQPEMLLHLALLIEPSDSGTIQSKVIPKWSRVINIQWGAYRFLRMDSFFFQDLMTNSLKSSRFQTGSFCIQSRHIKTGLDHVNFLQIQDLLPQPRKIKALSYGTSLQDNWSTSSVTTKQEWTQSSSIPMVLVLPVAAKIKLSRSMILEVKDLSSIMMLIMVKSMRSISIQMVGTFFRVVPTQLSRFGI